MSDTIDCRGLACPEPVLKVKAALEDMTEGEVRVRLDNPISRDNVHRFAESQGCAVDVTEHTDGGWELRAARGGARAQDSEPAAEARPDSNVPNGAKVMLVTSDTIGPDRELGGVLMRTFLNTLPQATERPDQLLFLNRGVFLTTEGSESLPVLEELVSAGTRILSCGTCLEFFDRRERLAVGEVSNMYDTVEVLTGPHRVVTIC